jgi:hypothetical protein
LFILFATDFQGMAEFLEERAAAGVGLIVTGAIS